MRPRLGRGRRLLGRRVQILLMLAAVATTLGAVSASGASFVSDSSTSVEATTTPLSTE